ncbi:hypothetical protein C8R44DRAFT_764132 [Mycena epipterygia]|nr:hypothetical protein C8R44DRAFT_764132 [Mycena epipterygia]
MSSRPVPYNGDHQALPASFDAHALRTRLAEIDEEMADLQSRLSRLAVARRPIVQSLQSVFYPVITLPPEVSAEIFLHYVDSAHIGGSGTLPHPPRKGGCGPLLLASICRTWRDIALALQPIWSSMQLYTGPATLSTTEKLLEQWLPRAGNHPLTIDISGDTDGLCALLAPSSVQ